MIALIRAKGGFYPRILCDHCGRPIECASEGYVVWDWQDEMGPVSNLRFIHKIVCDTRRHPMSMSLEEYLSNLLFNSKYNAEAAGRAVEAAARMGLTAFARGND